MRSADRRPDILFESSVATIEENVISSENTFSAALPFYAEAPTDSWRYKYVKRFIDLFCALMLILVFALPGLLIAAAILLTSRGPIFYRELRIGRNGRMFRIWKFRSMYANAEQRARIAKEHADSNVLEWRMRKHLQDPRITPIGGILRSWSLDELPQLFNVVLGDMSLIGPRPIIEKGDSVLWRVAPFSIWLQFLGCQGCGRSPDEAMLTTTSGHVWTHPMLSHGA